MSNLELDKIIRLYSTSNQPTSHRWRPRRRSQNRLRR